SFHNIEPLIYTDFYFHDSHGWRDTLKNVSKAFNAFTATSRQQIRAVSFYTAADNVRYTVKLFSRFDKGELQGELGGQSGWIRHTGFHTVNLDASVWVREGDKFHVVVELSDGGHAIDRTSQIPVLLGQQVRQPPGGPLVISRANAGESFY